MKYLSLVLFALLISSSSLEGKTKFKYDKTVDFTKFNTYSFMGWEKNCNHKLSEIDKTIIEEALKLELNEKGYEFLESLGDYNITLFVVDDESLAATTYNAFYGGFGYIRSTWGWGNGAAFSHYSSETYREGTLVIDFYDSTTAKLVWQGVLPELIKNVSVKRELIVNVAINQLIHRFPKKKQ